MMTTLKNLFKLLINKNLRRLPIQNMKMMILTTLKKLATQLTKTHQKTFLMMVSLVTLTTLKRLRRNLNTQVMTLTTILAILMTLIASTQVHSQNQFIPLYPSLLLFPVLAKQTFPTQHIFKLPSKVLLVQSLEMDLFTH